MQYVSQIKKLFIRKNLKIYTDGSYKNNLGSWAFVYVKKDKIIKEASGTVKKSNSLRMELTAAIEALEFLPAHKKATIYTDSQILIDAALCTQKPQEGRPNADLILRIRTLAKNRKITWTWVRAHSGEKYNERCDELCRLARPLKNR